MVRPVLPQNSSTLPSVSIVPSVPPTTPMSATDAAKPGSDRRRPSAGGGAPDGFAGGAGVLPRGIDLRLIASLAAVYLIWSSTYLAIRIAIIELPPLLMASLRYSTAGLVMLAFARRPYFIRSARSLHSADPSLRSSGASGFARSSGLRSVSAKRRGTAWPSAAEWLRVAPVGVLMFLGGNGFVAIGELSVSSGGTAVVCATMPLWTGVLAAVSGERPSRREWLALVVGFIGVLVLIGGPSLQGKPLHIVLIVLSPICWSLGSILARRHARSDRSDAVLASAMQMLTGGAALAVAAMIRGERLPAHAGTQSWLAFGYLLVFGSLIAFTAYNWLLRNARPVVATSYAYVNPILAVLIGAVVSGEALGVTTLVANVVIVGAVALAFGKMRSH
jgi:drug/metabolite transporter (DMT)-like permease